MIKLLTLLVILFPFSAMAEVNFSTADAKRGLKAFARCQACHTVEQGGRHKVGPNLANILGKQAGSDPNYHAYTPALKDSGIIWSYDTLDAYLTNSKKFLPRNRMAC